jgi:hypothetical protein
MKTILKVITVFVVLAVLGAVFYLYKSHSIAQERKYLFSIDVVRSLKCCLESREGTLGIERSKNLETSYLRREKLLEAKSIMESWKDSRNEDIRKLSGDFLQGVQELIFAQDLFLKIFKETSREQEDDLGLAIAKLQSGRNKLLGSSLELFSVISSKRRHETENKPIRFNLSKKQLASIVRYIDSNFEKELNEHKEKQNQKKEGTIKSYSLPEETWAVIFIKAFIEKGELVEAIEEK